MAWIQKKGTTISTIVGDKGYGKIKLYDSQYLKKGNGIYADFATQDARETFAGTISAFLDGTINQISSELGNYLNDAAVRTSDTFGDSATKVFKVKFSNSTDTCSIIANYVKTTKVTDLGTAIKGLSFKSASGTALTVLSVNVDTSI